MSISTLFKMIILLILLTGKFTYAQKLSNVNSPNGQLQISIFMDKAGVISYSVNSNTSPIIKSSNLGLILKSDPDFNKGWILSKSRQNSKNETWDAVWGPDKKIKNHYSEVVLRFKKGKSDKLNIYFRAFNDGVAFRYEIPAQANKDSIYITDELTEFSFAESAESWSIPQNFETDEAIYREMPISELQDANTPLTLKGKDYYAVIHEAALFDYAQMTLIKGNDSNTFKVDLVPWPDGIKVKTKTKVLSPWRVIIITKNISELLSAHVIENLNEPNKIEDTSWIKPGKYIGIWWEMHLGASKWYPSDDDIHGATTENMKKHIDFAAKNNIQAVLAEGWNKGWKKRKDFDFINSYADYDLPYLAKYAHDKGVDIIVHNETVSNIPNYEKQMEAAFSYYQKLGIHHIKTGYIAKMVPAGMHRHGQYMVNHYHKVIESAARHEIMLDVHEPIMDTGERRTYPNMMTREGVRGMEFEAWSLGNSPTHTTTLPFTRLMAGPVDYNPGIFDILFKNSDSQKLRTIKLDNPIGTVRVHSTLVHQLALFNILYSPLQMAPDLIRNYEGHPAFKYIKECPTSWDKTIFLKGDIGDYLALARKNGEEWYLSAITNEEGRSLTINPSFLDQGVKYLAEIYADGEGANWETNPESYSINTKLVNRDDQVTLKLAPGGGQVIVFRPQN